MATSSSDLPCGDPEKDRNPEIDYTKALAELAEKTEESEQEVIQRSVKALYRALIGNDPCQIGIPFHKIHSNRDADAVIRQLDATTFVQAEGFDFNGFKVPAGTKTDLASIPTALTWFVARYGRHTLPALLHDVRVKPEQPTARRTEWDTEFRDNLEAMKVPFIRRWSMWAAVTAATQKQHSFVRKASLYSWLGLSGLVPLLVAWIVLKDGNWKMAGLIAGTLATLTFIVLFRQRKRLLRFFSQPKAILKAKWKLIVGGAVGWLLLFCGSVAFMRHLFSNDGRGDWPVVLVTLGVLASPLVLSAFWEIRLKLYRFGLVSAYCVMVLTVPTILVIVTLGVYLLLEQAAKPFLSESHPVLLKTLKEVESKEAARRAEAGQPAG